ncbi:MAG: NAD-dependent epimerase/dehydratase family protein, partial [Gammaproteobacteria bacterium]
PISETFNIPHVFDSLEEMLKLDLDVIHVLLPPDVHARVAEQIINSGTHVFLEKPMGTNEAECQSLVSLAKAKNVKIGVNHNFAYLPSYQKMHNDVTNGSIGKLDHISLNWMFPLPQIQFGPFNIWMFQKPENLIYELGPHLIAFLVDLVGVPDSLEVSVSLPIDLPSGHRVYRRWHVYGHCKDVTFDLNLSVIPGYADRRISVRGHAATATCVFDRDIYYRDEPSGAGILFDNFLTAKNIAKQVVLSAGNNLFKAIKGTLKKAPNANPFSESVNLSILHFYQGLGGADGEFEVGDGGFGAKVVSICDRIASNAVFDEENKLTPCQVLDSLVPPTILVLGGTGFIGSYLVKDLVEKGLGVRVVTRGVAAANIALNGLPVELMQGDLASATFMDKALDGIHVVYHLAKAEGDNWSDYYDNDVLVTKNIAERSLAKGVDRFIYTGTIDSYYSANPNEIITGDTPLDSKIESRNHYARSKAACEELLMVMHREKGLPLVVFRPGIVIGKGCPPAHWGIGMFQSETRMQFWGTGENKLPLVLVSDVAKALVLGVDHPNIEGEVFLLTDAPILSARDYVGLVSSEVGTKIRSTPTPAVKFYLIDMLKELAKHIIRHPNRRLPSYRDWDSRSHRAVYDNEKTRRVLGWQPAGTKEAIIQFGVVASVRGYFS